MTDPTLSRGETTMSTMPKAMRAGRCEVCGAFVVAWRRGETRYSRITTRLLKLLAMANHVKTLHVQEG